jgi:hypothetical protein
MSAKYLMVCLALALVQGALVNHKIVRNVNFDSPNTESVTHIEILNDSPDGSAEINSY